MGLFDWIFGKKQPTAPQQAAHIATSSPAAAPVEDFSVAIPGRNTGIIEQAPTPTSWIAGGETGITGSLEDSGQYDAWLPDEEAQSFYTPAHFDTQSCVSFSATNNIEILLNRMRAKGQLSAKAEKFLVDNGYVNPQTNKVNVSDRFVAKTSGTTQNGNYLEAVGDAIRKCGLVPESAWPMPDWDALKGKSQDEIWSVYMATIPANVLNLGLEFLKYFTPAYQWVATGSSTPVNLRGSLKQGPFQIASAVCSPWNSNEGMPPIAACGCGAQHGTCIYGFDHQGNTIPFKLFDSYRSFRKFLAEDYCIPWGFQYSIKEAVQQATVPIQYTFRTQLTFGDPESDEVNRLQKGLQDLGFMTKGVFGPFGPATRAALGKFQTSVGIQDPGGQGTNFGPKTREKFNAALLALLNK